MTRRAVMGSLAAHGVVALLVVALAPAARDRPTEQVRDAIEIAIVRGAHAITQAPSEIGAAGGHAVSVRTPDVEPVRAARSRPRPAHRPSAVAAEDAAATEVLETTVAFEDVGDGGAPGAGEGGAGTGRGIGRGDGEQLTTSARQAAALVADMQIPMAKPERAQPPVLTYPARQKEAPLEAMYVARVTIDPQGFVVGVRLLRGPGGAGDFHVEDAIWRFRYRPARDAYGRPMKITIEQQFLLDD